MLRIMAAAILTGMTLLTWCCVRAGSVDERRMEELSRTGQTDGTGVRAPDSSGQGRGGGAQCRKK